MMGDNMGHMDHLEAVAAADLENLREKERTYKGSWKKRGGVGAFMMLARKWDRLEGMLTHDTPADKGGYNWDVFAAIEADRSGMDGTVLAEVRDLRRYLLLVEAEMLSRWVGKPPVLIPPLWTLYMDLALAWGVTHGEAERRVLKIAFGRPDYPATRDEVLKVLISKWRCSAEEVIRTLKTLDLSGTDSRPVPAEDSNRHAIQAPEAPKVPYLMDGLPREDYINAKVPSLVPVHPDVPEGVAIVDRTRFPINELPRLPLELNYEEWIDLVPHYRWLYVHDLISAKYLLRSEYLEHWGRKP